MVNMVIENSALSEEEYRSTKEIENPETSPHIDSTSSCYMY
jgi:hypothetical protein